VDRGDGAACKVAPRAPSNSGPIHPYASVATVLSTYMYLGSGTYSQYVSTYQLGQLGLQRQAAALELRVAASAAQGCDPASVLLNKSRSRS